MASVLGGSRHDGLRQLNHEVMSTPVDWILDMDLARFFDTMPHREILRIFAYLPEKVYSSLVLRFINDVRVMLPP